MENETKFKLDGLELLRKAAWDSFARRTEVEWKISLSLWTAFAVFIGSIATGKGPAPSYTVVVIFSVVAMITCSLHYWWLRGMGEANRLDRTREVFFAKRMMEIISEEFPENLKIELSRRAEKKLAVWKDYAHTFQLGVTIILSLGVSRPLQNGVIFV